ncbi:hypothetical protein BU15DRAFT_80968 [Melanogaster broomeanus]|nr:hypothetical protein BU15DRAFT_80968 [Melanogaster broomeanus]
MAEAATDQTIENDAISRALVGGSEQAQEEDENIEDEEYDDEDEDEDEAEDIARRLKEQLWADISKAQAAQASAGGQNAHTAPSVEAAPGAQLTSSTSSRKKDAALETMRSILALTTQDALAYSTLASTVVPGTNNDNVLNVLNRIVHTRSISKQLAKSLSPMLVLLARSDTLFATMRHSNAPALQLDKGKRKRDESEEEQRQNESRAFKRPNIVYHDFQRQITDAVQVVFNALSANSPANGSLDPSIISSIQLQLHQLFLFAVTSSAGGGPEMNPLQEIGGLIQVLGVLSGTAVYPCLMPGCRKTFARLYSLRGHQRVHAAHRPFRCAACPASFARNHDLKRHAKLHEKKAWQCAGCDKMFSRRDAIKRHKNSSAARGAKGESCVNAAIREVEVNKESDEDAAREGRRTRMWADIVTSSASAVTPYAGYGDDGSMEEGEVHSDVIRRMQAAVLSLHATLQGHVARALGTDRAAPPLHLDPTGGQATLASVIARAQMQNLASQLPPQIPPMDYTDASGNPEGSFSNLDDNLPTGIPTDPTLAAESSRRPEDTAPAPQLSLYGLSEEQTKLLEQAIANAASAAQAQAEAEAAMEEEEDDDDDDDEEHDLDEINDTLAITAQAAAASGQ